MTADKTSQSVGKNGFSCQCIKLSSEKLLSLMLTVMLENTLDTLCTAQIWYDFSIFGMFSVSKSRGHTSFVLSKMYEGHFQVIHNLVQLN